jgi:bisphosphoglycerate-dependent phosphoglycerate mutase
LSKEVAIKDFREETIMKWRRSYNIRASHGKILKIGYNYTNKVNIAYFT